MPKAETGTRVKVIGVDLAPKPQRSQPKTRLKDRQDKQAGRPRPLFCEVCRGDDTISFDHCHTHGHFRGWLCRKCNLILGLAGDDANRLRLLAHYLETTRRPDPLPFYKMV